MGLIGQILIKWARRDGVSHEDILGKSLGARVGVLVRQETNGRNSWQPRLEVGDKIIVWGGTPYIKTSVQDDVCPGW